MAGTVKIRSVVNAAARAGVIEDAPSARATCAASIARNHKIGEGLLRLAVDAGRRVSAGVKAGTSRTAPATDYPAGWLPPVSSRVGGNRPAGTDEARAAAGVIADVPYPTAWVGGAGSRQAAKIVEAHGGQAAPRSVHAAGDTAALIEAERQAALAAQAESQSHTVDRHSDPHDLIAASGENARRQVALEAAEVERMRAGAWSR
jgi:hypothetical protein